MSEGEARNFVRQILQGVQYMHKKGIVHLDLKASSYFLNFHWKQVDENWNN